MTDADDAGDARRRGFFPLAVQLVNLGVLATLFGLSIEWWGRLPERIPIHLGPDGTPDRWAGPGFWAWFVLPLVGAGLTAFFFALRVLKGVSERKPWIISVPRRKIFLSLPPAGRRRIVAAAFDLLALFPLPANLFLLYGQWVNLQVATMSTGRLPWTSVAAFLGAAILILAVYLLRLDRLVRAEAGARAAPGESPD